MRSDLFAFVGLGHRAPRPCYDCPSRAAAALGVPCRLCHRCRRDVDTTGLETDLETGPRSLISILRAQLLPYLYCWKNDSNQHIEHLMD